MKRCLTVVDFRWLSPPNSAENGSFIAVNEPYMTGLDQSGSYIRESYTIYGPYYHIRYRPGMVRSNQSGRVGRRTINSNSSARRLSEILLRLINHVRDEGTSFYGEKKNRGGGPLMGRPHT